MKKKISLEVFDYPIVINGKTYESDLAEHLFIDRSILDEEFVEHARLFAYYATLAEVASSQADALDAELELLEARLDAVKRAEAQDAMVQNPKFKYTETMYHNLVIGDKEYQAKQKECLVARELARKLMAAAKALDKKTETLKKFNRIENNLIK